MTEQFKPDPIQAAELAAQMNRRSVSVDDPYLQTLGLMTNHRMVANEILYAQASEEYSTHGYWTSKAERNYFLTAKPDANEAFRLLYRHARAAPVLKETFVTEMLEWMEDGDQMDEIRDPHSWRVPHLSFLTNEEKALLKAPELYPAMEGELEPSARTQKVQWPMNRMQLRAFWRMVRLCEDERGFSLEWLQDVCSSNWFQTLERRPKKSGVY